LFKGRALLYDWIGVPSNGDKTSGYETPVEPGNETVARVNGGFYNDVATNANASEDISSEGNIFKPTNLGMCNICSFEEEM
jgi:hypothetical protein